MIANVHKMIIVNTTEGFLIFAMIPPWPVVCSYSHHSPSALPKGCPNVSFHLLHILSLKSQKLANSVYMT